MVVSLCDFTIGLQFIIIIFRKGLQFIDEFQLTLFDDKNNIYTRYQFTLSKETKSNQKIKGKKEKVEEIKNKIQQMLPLKFGHICYASIMSQMYYIIGFLKDLVKVSDSCLLEHTEKVLMVPIRNCSCMNYN